MKYQPRHRKDYDMIENQEWCSYCEAFKPTTWNGVTATGLICGHVIEMELV